MICQHLWVDFIDHLTQHLQYIYNELSTLVSGKV